MTRGLLCLMLAGCVRTIEIGADEDAGFDAGLEMVLITDGPRGAFYIDRYEATTVGGTLGSEDQDTDGDGKIADRRAAEAHAQSHGLVWDDNGGEESVTLTTTVAHSVKGALPTGGVSFYQAASACSNAGKRLCTAAEWQWACQGGSAFNTFPYGDVWDGSNESGHDCWVGGLSTAVNIAGTATACVTPNGVFDMTGNLREWADTNPRGGSYSDTASATDTHHVECGSTTPVGPGVAYDDQGFRCCR